MRTSASIGAIEYHLPEKTLSNEQLSVEFPEWPVEAIYNKTGVANRHIAGEAECASDLGVIAAQKLFSSGACAPDEIDYLLFCTQSPDYLLPTTACLMQNALHLPTSCGALDFNLGCSGFVYGLGLAKGLIESGQAKRNVLLITADTYSKYIYKADKSVRTLFGDGAAATLIRGIEVPDEMPYAIGPFINGTDGKGAQHLIVPAGASRYPRSSDTAQIYHDGQGNVRSNDNLLMSGPEVFTFTLQTVPSTVQRLLTQTGKTLEEIDLFVFHQANRYMLEHLRKKIGIASAKFFLAFEDCGNTVSASIPIALKRAQEYKQLKNGNLVMLVGFGGGYSWSATLLRWKI